MFTALHAPPPSTLDGAASFYSKILRDEVWHAQSAAVQAQKPRPSAIDTLTTAIDTLHRRGYLRMPKGATARELAARAVSPNQPGLELDLSTIVRDLAQCWVSPRPIPKA